MYRPFLLLILILILSCAENKSVTENEMEVMTLTDDLYGGTGGISVDVSGNIYSSDFGPVLGGLSPTFPLNSRIFKITYVPAIANTSVTTTVTT